MPERKEPGRSKGGKYLSKMEHFLKALRDLEEDLVEALQDLDDRSASSRSGSSLEPESRLLPINPMGWATPRETARTEESSSGRERRRKETPRREIHSPPPSNPPRLPQMPLTPHYSGSHDPDLSLGTSTGYDPHDGYDSTDQSDLYETSYSCPPPHVACGSQVIVNGQLEIPECKPDVEAILRFKPVCRVTDWQCVHTVEGRKIVVTGIVEIGVEYVADHPDQPVHFVHFVVPFHTFFLCHRPLQGIRCDVEFKHSEMLNPRTISKVILLSVRGIEHK